MAMQTGISLSRLFVLAGAGYTGTILVKNGKLSDVLGELQALLKGLERSEEQEGDADLSDAVAAQVRRLAMEVRHLASARQITVLNGNGGVNATSLIIPAASLGVLGYGYMWWKGLSFSDLMYVTKKSMATAVEDLKNNLSNLSEALSVAKKHLTQRIQSLKDKVEKQTELSKDILKDVEETCENVYKVEHTVRDLKNMMFGLDERIDSLAYKQDITNIGMYYLCSMADGRKGKLTESMQEQLKLGEQARRLLKAPSSMGLKEITDSLSGTVTQSPAKTIESNDQVDGHQRLLHRPTSALV